MTIFEAIILAVVEGVTEFLPVSSTGHMIIASSLMGIEHDEYTKSFTIAIQLGAILSVFILYLKRFFKSVGFYLKLFVGFLPALVAGLLFGDKIDALLENVTVVAVSLIVGGIVLVFIDRFFSSDEQHDINDVDAISYKRSFIIGLVQCIALIPGVSRSAATIIGGLTQKLTRKTAAEFSFFLAVPTMFAATVYALFVKDTNPDPAIESKGYEIIFDHAQHTTAFVIGNIVAFLIAIIAMRTFVNFLTKHGFKVFGYYRIIVGSVLLLLLALGVDLKIV